MSFVPTDQLLVQLLQQRIDGVAVPMPFNFVLERDVYGVEEPWQIWEWANSEDNDVYLFTKLKKKDPKGSRVCRSVGSCGSWKGEDSGTDVKTFDTGASIGKKKRFHYENKGSEHHRRWLLHEYSIPDTSSTNSYVLCRLRKNPVKIAGSKRRAAQETQETHMSNANPNGVVMNIVQDSKRLKVDLCQVPETLTQSSVEVGSPEGPDPTFDLHEFAPQLEADIFNGNNEDTSGIQQPMQISSTSDVVTAGSQTQFIEESELKRYVEKLEQELKELHEENGRLMDLFENAMYQRDEYRRMMEQTREETRLDLSNFDFDSPDTDPAWLNCGQDDMISAQCTANC